MGTCLGMGTGECMDTIKEQVSKVKVQFKGTGEWIITGKFVNKGKGMGKEKGIKGTGEGIRPQVNEYKNTGK